MSVRYCRYIESLKITYNNMRVEHALVEWSDKEVQIGKSHEHSAVDERVALVDLGIRLVSVPSVGASGNQVGVGKIELRRPGDVLYVLSAKFTRD